jgi:hypothetical protein
MVVDMGLLIELAAPGAQVSRLSVQSTITIQQSPTNQ